MPFGQLTFVQLISTSGLLLGHFEGDSIVSKGHNGRIVIVNERKTGYLMARLMPRLICQHFSRQLF